MLFPIPGQIRSIPNNPLRKFQIPTRIQIQARVVRANLFTNHNPLMPITEDITIALRK